MKRYLAIILAVVMALGMVTGCSGKKDSEKKEENKKEESKKEENLLADKSLEDILNSIYEEKMPEFPLMNTEVDLTDENAVKYSTGLSKEDAGKVKEVLASEPAMGSQAYSLVLIRLNDVKDAETIANAVKEGIDPRKWICVEADDLRVSASGDVVMLVMVSTVFADSFTAEDMTNAFAKTAGGNLSVDLK